ncbi:hypothetical protein L0337_12490 [candidate division KSB1 bacterium]|nr:hypothetical protein [candidate division KSB1 bacterium]
MAVNVGGCAQGCSFNDNVDSGQAVFGISVGHAAGNLAGGAAEQRSEQQKRKKQRQNGRDDLAHQTTSLSEVILSMLKSNILTLCPCFCRSFRSAWRNHPAKTFRRQKDGEQKNVCRLLDPVIVNFPGVMPNAIFLSFIFLSWPFVQANLTLPSYECDSEIPAQYKRLKLYCQVDFGFFAIFVAFLQKALDILR